jgi:hypothetical protein
VVNTGGYEVPHIIGYAESRVVLEPGNTDGALLIGLELKRPAFAIRATAKGGLDRAVA